MLAAVKRLLTEARSDNITGEGAKVAFYLFLSIFPAVLVLFSLTGLFGGQEAFRWIMARLEANLPAETAGFMERFVRQVTDQREPGVLSIGLVLTLWSASGGFAALADGLNTMYDVEEGRSWWRKRATAVGVLLASIVLLLGGTALILTGPEVVRALGAPSILTVLLWPFAFLLLTVFVSLVYYVLPDRDQSGEKGAVLAGALAAAALWLAATAGLRFYVANFGSYSATYGFVGAVIVLMLWLYLTAVVVLFGGEVSATLARRGEPRKSSGKRRRAA